MSQAARIAPADAERRGTIRIVTRIGAGLRRQGQTGEPATILDISSHGCRVEAQEHVSEGSNIWIKSTALPSKPVFARVVWSEGRLFGCEFVTPLPHAVLSRMIAQADPGLWPSV